MNFKKVNKNRIASAFMEYALILGVVSLALVMMNTYIKRGVQGRIKDMTDYFIGGEQAADSNPTAITTSNSTTNSDSTSTTEELLGGGRRLAFLDTTNINTSSRVVDQAKPLGQDPFTPSGRGSVTPPTRPDDSDYYFDNPEEDDNVDWETEVNIDILERERDRLLQKATALEETAAEIERQGRELVDSANSMDCPRRHGGDCRAARNQMRIQGENLIIQAEEIRQEARQLREEANAIQARIDELQSGR